MNRGVALTSLGAALVLGGLFEARGEELSGSVDGAPSPPALPSWGGVLPSLPQNWSDLPVQFRASESVGYNSNILGTPSNSSFFGNLHQGDFELISNYGGSARTNWEGQQFFIDGSYGLTRYLHDVSLNSVQNSFDAGVNWIFTSRCSGTLVGAESVSQSPFAQQVISTQAVNSVHTVSLNETANCLISGEYSAVFNSGINQSTNSTLVNEANNAKSKFVAAGLNYNITQTNSIQALLTITGTEYTNRSATLNNAGLLNNLTQDQLTVTYTRQINPNLNFVVSAGLVGVVNNSSFTLAIPSTILPQYSASVTWSATPKLGVSASVGRSVSPPTTIIGNVQSTESATLGLNYSVSSKVALSANVSTSYATSAFTPFVAGVATGLSPVNLSAQKSYSAGASLSYTVTPFIGANLSYQYSRSVQSGLVTPQSTLMLNVNYNPH
jgi:hypothetical protein